MGAGCFCVGTADPAGGRTAACAAYAACGMSGCVGGRYGDVAEAVTQQRTEACVTAA